MKAYVFVEIMVDYWKTWTRDSSVPKWVLISRSKIQGSPDSTNFGPPGDRTIAKIVLSGD